jgi:hypothetical protein
VVVGVFALIHRGVNRDRDLGVVSHQWIVQHRDASSPDSR